MGKQVQRIMLATSASLIRINPSAWRVRKGVNDLYIRPKSNLNDYEGDIGGTGHVCSVDKSADT